MIDRSITRARSSVRVIAISSLALFAGMTAAPSSAQTAKPEGNGDTEATGLQDIVVTARRIEERLQDVPLSITAMDRQALADNKISQVQDIGASVPNMITGKSSVPGLGQVAIRGVQGQALPRIGLDNRVGVYLDGVYLARSQGQSFNLADIERIEVLKGPQGTVFGRNVTAGSINIVTAAPTGLFGGTLEGGVGSRDRRRLRATLELPDFAGFSARMTYMRNSQDGDIKNTSAGFRPGPIVVSITSAAIPAGFSTEGLPYTLNYTPKAAAKTFGGSKSDSAFLAVRYEGIDDLTVDYKFDWTNQKETNSANHITGFDAGIGRGCIAAAIALGASVNQCGTGTLAQFGIANATGIISAAPTITNEGGVNGVFTATGAQAFSLGFTRPDSKGEFFTAPATIKSWGHNLTLNYDATDNLTLRSITGYRELRTQVQQDLGGGSFSLLNSFLTAVSPTLYPTSLYPAGGSTPYLTGGSFNNQRQNQISQEFQSIGKIGDSVDYLVGLYYFREKGSANQFTVQSNIGAVSNLLASLRGLAPGFVQPTQKGIPPIAANGGTNNWGLGSLLAGDLARVTSSSKAIFGRVTYRPVENVDLVVGGRYTQDIKTGREPGFFVGFFDFDQFTAGQQAVPTYLRQKFNKFTYDGTATYHFNQDVNVYARYATAYLAGGAIRNSPFKPETTKAAEVGFKSELFDRRVRLNAAAFWQKSRDYQFTNTGSLTAPVIGSYTASSLANLGSARVKGGEVELTVAPTRGLTLSASGGYADQKYSQISTGGTPVTPPTIPLSPKWTFQGSVQYNTQPLVGDTYLSIRLDANYRSKYGGSAQPIPTTTSAAYPAFVLPVELLRLYGLPVSTAAEVATSTTAYTNLFNQNFPIGGFWVANARLSVVDIPIGASKARLSGYVKNLFDEDKIVFESYYGGTTGATYQSKREFGVDLSLTF